MRIEPILPAHVRVFGGWAQRDGPPVAHHGIEHPDDVTVSDSALGVPLIIAAHDVIMLSDPQHAVQDVLPIVALIERHVEPTEPPLGLGPDDQHIAVLTQQRHHAVARVGVHQHTLLGEDFFEGGHAANRNKKNASSVSHLFGAKIVSFLQCSKF